MFCWVTRSLSLWLCSCRGLSSPLLFAGLTPSLRPQSGCTGSACGDICQAYGKPLCCVCGLAVLKRWCDARGKAAWPCCHCVCPPGHLRQCDMCARCHSQWPCTPFVARTFTAGLLSCSSSNGWFCAVFVEILAPKPQLFWVAHAPPACTCCGVFRWRRRRALTH
jgi:hypothetical protein